MSDVQHIPDPNSRMQRFWALRTGTWSMRVMVEAETIREAQQVAELIPESVWMDSVIFREPKRHLSGIPITGVDPKSTQQPWRPGDPAPEDVVAIAQDVLRGYGHDALADALAVVRAKA